MGQEEIREPVEIGILLVELPEGDLDAKLLVSVVAIWVRKRESRPISHKGFLRLRRGEFESARILQQPDLGDEAILQDPPATSAEDAGAGAEADTALDAREWTPAGIHPVADPLEGVRGKGKSAGGARARKEAGPVNFDAALPQGADGFQEAASSAPLPAWSAATTRRSARAGSVLCWRQRGRGRPRPTSSITPIPSLQANRTAGANRTVAPDGGPSTRGRRLRILEPVPVTVLTIGIRGGLQPILHHFPEGAMMPSIIGLWNACRVTNRRQIRPQPPGPTANGRSRLGSAGHKSCGSIVCRDVASGRQPPHVLLGQAHAGIDPPGSACIMRARATPWSRRPAKHPPGSRR